MSWGCHSMPFQGCNKTQENMLIDTKLIANVPWMTIEKLMDPASSSQCWSVIGSFVIQRETIGKCCSTSNRSKECQILKQSCCSLCPEPLLSNISVMVNISYHLRCHPSSMYCDFLNRQSYVIMFVMWNENYFGLSWQPTGLQMNIKGKNSLNFGFPVLCR